MAKHSLNMKKITLKNEKSATRVGSRSADFIFGPVSPEKPWKDGSFSALDNCSNQYPLLGGAR
jgi:hypothetical protein